MKLIERLAPLKKYSIIISFLALEVFAFISFSFGNSFVLFGVLSFALMVLLILVTIRDINVNGIAHIAILFIPLVLYVLLTAVGLYSRFHAYVGDFNIAEVVFVPIGILSVALCGYLMSLNETFKLKHFFVVIYLALAILVFLNLLVNLINLGFFYPIIYKGFYMYYAGLKSSIPVNEMAYTLEGFKFIEVRMDHYVLYPSLLLSSSAFLFFVSPKTEKKVFFIYLTFTVIGVLALAFIPSIYALLAGLAVIVIDLIVFLSFKFKVCRKVVKIGFILLAIAFATIMIILFVINQDFGASLYNSFKNNAFLNKIFISNRFVKVFSPLISNLFVNNRFFGFYENPITALVSQEAHLSGSYAFDNIMTGGLLGALAFLFILLFAVKGFKRYLFKNNDNQEYRYKGLMFAFFAIFFIYSLFFNNGEYGIFYSICKPIYMTGPFMLAVFMIFYSYSQGINKKEETVNE